ncbi:hypothetical protein [Polyangium mundeleinium]|uniref:DUF2169 domain-containing protein n=1 Tax=Polyangium mundeleinium TaxID=2995306 RepID=A0ABT5EI22_9BACT|nr:hypothetical protein [Polyangium mundeleinium]MDC0741481.1 hypothetical protein [Polyangium mundeleinium]
MAELTRLFGEPLFARIDGLRPGDTPSLRGARLFVGEPRADEGAWHEALGWLREFRQGTPRQKNAPADASARVPGDGRPGRSNWPEPDKMRHLARMRPGQTQWQHPPRYNGDPAWARAAFGIPIIGQFQRRDRHKELYPHPEPEDFELRFRLTPGGPLYDRLASPLIVKPLPLLGNRLAPMALWLHRGYPAGAKVVLKWKGANSAVPGSEAPFDKLVGQGETPRFRPLQGKTSLKDAFLDWLTRQPRVTELR